MGFCLINGLYRRSVLSFTDLKIASSAVFNTFNTAALTFRKDIIDIYSCSFANFHTGTKTYPLLRDQEDAFRLGTSLVRHILKHLNNTHLKWNECKQTLWLINSISCFNCIDFSYQVEANVWFVICFIFFLPFEWALILLIKNEK